MSDLAEEWFGGKTRILPHIKIGVYQRLEFLWEKFGLTIRDLDEIAVAYPGLLDDLMTIGRAKKDVQDSQSSGGEIIQAPMAGKNVVKNTLLKQ